MALKFLRWCLQQCFPCCKKKKKKPMFQLDSSSEEDSQFADEEEYQCNPLNVIIPHEPQWRRIFTHMYLMSSFSADVGSSSVAEDSDTEVMPALHLEVALSEALEVRGAPLQEEELWAVLTQATEALQDFFLTGMYHGNLLWKSIPSKLLGGHLQCL